MPSALTIQNLHKTYRNGVVALRGVDLDVKEGDFFALLGPNGAGKSTTIGIVCSLVNKSSGKVSVFGHDIDTELEAAKSCIGLVPQEFNFNQFEPVEEIVINQGGYYGIDKNTATQRAQLYLKKLGLWEKRRQMARELSGGMKRRLMIARALVHEPRLLILDEPTAGVDIEIRRSMWTFLREINQQGTTIILTTHYLEEAESLCKNIAIIDKGITIENTAMNDLLRRLQIESFILDLDQPIGNSLDNFTMSEGCFVEKQDETTLVANISKEYSINDLYSELSKHDIKVLSMRNKSNRLEELFVSMVEGK
ncbi:MAG: ABC transporter ATP-binding protein [Gammaproteobacteria bacterium]|jgi:ABC-2 type transport system ATP-binding protein